MAIFSTSQLYIHSENIVVSVIIAVIGMLGLVLNGSAILAVRYNPALRSSFGLLCLSHSIANIGVLLIFVFWIPPITLIKSDLSTQLIGKLFGMVSVILWYACSYSHLAISLNRVIAITYPLQVPHLLTAQNTAIVIVICWMLGLLVEIPYFWTQSCFFAFDTEQWMWRPSKTPCGYITVVLVNFYITLIISILIVLLDCITLISLKSKQKTVYQNVLFTCHLVGAYYIRQLFHNRWALFFTTTFLWELNHALDGLIVVLFHFRLSHFRIKAHQPPKVVALFTRR